MALAASLQRMKNFTAEHNFLVIHSFIYKVSEFFFFKKKLNHPDKSMVYILNGINVLFPCGFSQEATFVVDLLWMGTEGIMGLKMIKIQIYVTLWKSE